jgi:hypothetical protein
MMPITFSLHVSSLRYVFTFVSIFMILATFLVILLNILQKCQNTLFDRPYSVCEPFRAYCEAAKKLITKIYIKEDHFTKFLLCLKSAGITYIRERNQAFVNQHCIYSHACIFYNCNRNSSTRFPQLFFKKCCSTTAYPHICNLNFIQ